LDFFGSLRWNLLAWQAIGSSGNGSDVRILHFFIAPPGRVVDSFAA